MEKRLILWRRGSIKSAKKIQAVKNTISYSILAAIAVVMLFPTLIMVLSSFKSYDEYYSIAYKFLPEVWHIDNYARVFQVTDNFLVWIGNTLILMISNTAICTVSTIFVAYGFAKFRCKLGDILFVVLLSTMMIPWAVTMIPSYIVWARMGMVNTFVPLIIPSIGGSAYYVFMFRQYMRGLPSEIMEAAEIDGANSMRRLWLIVVPNTIPAIVTMVLLTLMGIWGDYLGPLIYLRSPEMFNISLGLNMMRSDTTWGRQDTPMLLAASVLMAIPSIILYFTGTKIFAKGLSLQGGVKG